MAYPTDEEDAGLNSLQLLLEAMRGKIKLNSQGIQAVISAIQSIIDDDPDLWKEMVGGLSKEDQSALARVLGGDLPEEGAPKNGFDPRVQALKDLQTAMGFGGARAISRDITETSQVVSETDIARRTRRYIDVPTPEEFLNQFQNAFAAHLKGITGMQGVSRLAAQFAIDNMEMFLSDYLGTLGQMAARGEDIFAVVGATGEPQFLGERPGEQMTTQKAITGTALSEKQTNEIENLTKTLEGMGITGAESTSIIERTRENFLNKNKETLSETEDVFRRPNLAYIFKLSPLAHLQKQWTPESLMLRYEGFRGARQRQGQPGEGVVSARRVV